jgi:hypothetical protein
LQFIKKLNVMNVRVERRFSAALTAVFLVAEPASAGGTHLSEIS